MEQMFLQKIGPSLLVLMGVQGEGVGVNWGILNRILYVLNVYLYADPGNWVYRYWDKVF